MVHDPFELLQDSNHVEAVQPDLSHKDICKSLDEELNDIHKDPLLRDLPTNSTIDEIKSRVALEKGKAIIVNLKRHSETEEVTRESKKWLFAELCDLLLFHKNLSPFFYR